MQKLKPLSTNLAVGIVRVSTAEQAQEERYSIPHQRAHIVEECQARKLDLVHIFEFVQSGARVLSDTSKERQQILKFIQDHGISVVVVHELDRLARSMLDTLLFVDQLNKLGVTFISIHDGFDTSTPQGQLQMHILAAFAEYFRKQLASKVMGGMIERARQGKHMGRRPLGYQIGPNGYEIDEEEAKIVRLIFSMYLDQNLGLRAIADQLNSMGLKSLRGNPWSHISVREIIENEVYTGTFVWSDIRVENNHPAIIDRQTWEKAQARRNRKAQLGGRAQNDFYLLSGLLRCGTCRGATMVGRKARKGKYVYKYYICNNYASRGLTACPGGYFRADRIEEMVLQDIEDILKLGPSVRRELIPSDVDVLKETLELKKRELERLQNMLIRAAEAYEAGQYDLAFFSQRRETILAQQAAVRDEIENLQNQLACKLSPEDIERRIKSCAEIAATILKEQDPIKKKAHLQCLIDHIEVRSEEDITIFYRI